MSRLVLLLLMGLSSPLLGCLELKSVRCTGETEEWYCPEGMQCHEVWRCVEPHDVEVCEGVEYGETCLSRTGARGVCTGGACIVYELCDNGQIDAPEVCDGTHVGNETCMAQGFYPGVLTCLPGCYDYDTSNCGGQCPDGVKNGPEVCDGSDFGDDSCQARGFYSGSLICDEECENIDASGCTGTCGDGTCDLQFGETLDSCPADDCPLRTVAISAGSFHSCAVMEDGTAWCWGKGEFGRLGNGGTDDAHTPVQVVGMADATVISAGYQHSCALKSDGSAWCWGYGALGRLGDGITVDSDVPVQVVGLTNLVDITTGTAHSCAVDSDGTAWCWGRNTNGELGHGITEDNSPTPVQVVGMTDAVAISAGFRHSCALRVDGTAWCWGTSEEGQLGNGVTNVISNTPVQVLGGVDAVNISAGNRHSCVVEGNGSAWCWGLGTDGRLGNGDTQDSNVPIQVSGLTNATVVSAGTFATCALASDGSAWCWGLGTDGQLGQGAFDSSTTPVQVSGLTHGAAISHGREHSCVVTDYGSAWCWGLGEFGRLGNGSTASSPAPEAVSDIFPPP